MNYNRRLLAELMGTFWLVFCGCGSAVVSAAFPELGIGILGVSLAFGLAVLTGAYALGHVSGGHFNPAVTVGIASAGKFPRNEVLPYVVSQVIGGIIAAGVLYLIASGSPDFDPYAGFASNGYRLRSPAEFGLFAGFLTEFLMTGAFIFLILEVTSPKAVKGFAPLSIGLMLTLIHLVTIPITNTSVNPARSTGPAIFAGVEALAQLWMFWVAPLLGGFVGGTLHRWFASRGETADLVELQPESRPLKRAASR